jgi:hypothetical protein
MFRGVVVTKLWILLLIAEERRCDCVGALDGGEEERRGEGRSDDEVAVSALILATETTKSKVRLGSSFLRAARFCGGWGCNCGMVGVNSAATVPEWIAVSGGHGQD